MPKYEIPHNNLMNGQLVPMEVVNATVNEVPIKGDQLEIDNSRLLIAQADVVRGRLFAINDYTSAYGTCSDERLREGLLNGQSTEFRHSVFGGPTIYATSILELLGELPFGDAKERVAEADARLNEAGFKRGAHIGCAACNSLHDWMGIIKNKPDLVIGYAKSQLKDQYDEKYADAVMSQATRVHDNSIYKNWSEENLKQVYGEEAGKAFEVLADVEHNAQTLVRIKKELIVADISAIYRDSIFGVGSFIMNDPYANAIEHVLTAGPDALTKKRQAEHAREIIIAAVSVAVPNEQLYQIDIN